MLNWDDLYTLAERVSAKVALDFPGIEAEDICQEIMLHVLERKATFERGNYSERQLVNALTGAAKQYAGRERYAYTFNSGQYVYTPREVRAIFKHAFFNPEVREKMPEREPGLVMDNACDLLALFDVDDAFKKLSSADQVAIIRHYRDDLEYDGDAEKRRTLRAIDKVTRHLNNRLVMQEVEREGWEGPSARPAMSNAAAMHATGSNY